VDKQVSESQIAGITIGTAGHIDHGKSALVKRFTGIDPDRLKEEKIRGMTIDLGYAFYESRGGKRVGIIDVPGHERFVKNMVTGAASIDIVILVVAADDGVMPQTREHLEIMKVFGLKKGLVALTKIDLVDEEMLEMAIEDVKEFLAGSFLEEAPILPLSSTTSQGVDRFIDQLEALIDRVEHSSPSGLFRMPVQRVFSAKGFGTVVTGVPISGQVQKGDSVEVLPQGFKGKVRGLQAFGQPCNEGRAGHRIAVNITDVDYREIHRGCTVTVPGFFKPTLFFEGHLTYFESTAFPLKNRTEVKVHAGCSEEMGTVILMDTRVLTPGQKGYIQVRLQRPLVVAPGDCFLIRRHSPATSLGGGTVIEASDRKAKRFKEYILDPLKSKHFTLAEETASLLNFEMSRCKNGFFSPVDIAVATGQSVEIVDEVVTQAISAGDLIEAGSGNYLHQKRYHELADEMLTVLDRLHQESPLKLHLDIQALRNRIKLEGQALQKLLKIMEKEKSVVLSKGGYIQRAGHRIRLNDEQTSQVQALNLILNETSLSPPPVEELVEKLSLDVGKLEEIADYLILTGETIRIANFYFAVESVNRLKEAVIESCNQFGEVKIPWIRDTFSTSRKYLIPLMEYLDEINLTRREGDKRFLKES